MKHMRFIVAALLLSMPLAGHAAGDPEAGRRAAKTCMGCHGVEGYRNAYPSYHVPKVGGQHEDYIVSALKAYRSGKRSHQTMQSQAANLTDEDIANIAAYFAQQK